MICFLCFLPKIKTIATEIANTMLIENAKKSKVQGPLFWKMAPPTARDIIAPIVVPVCMMANRIPFTGTNLYKKNSYELSLDLVGNSKRSSNASLRN